MRIQFSPFLRRLLAVSRTSRLALVAGAIAAVSLAGVACSGDDEAKPDATQAAGAVATATAGATATTEPVRVGGTLVPAGTPTAVAPATSGGTSQVAPETVAIIDMVPCSDQTYYEEQTVSGEVHALTYKNVPEGTPILFPFEEGRLRLIDARAGAILLVYDVKDVGVFSVQAAGSSTLDRSIDHVVEGTVIGHFRGAFEKEDTHVFEGYQLFAVAGTEELVEIGDKLHAGTPVDLDVQGCIALP